MILLVLADSKINETYSKSDKDFADSSIQNKYNNDNNDNNCNNNNTRKYDTTTRRLVTSEINIPQVLNSITDPDGQSGATVFFAGSVRNMGKAGSVKEMYYEAYMEMAEKIIKEIEHMAMAKWGIKRIRIVHRIGRLQLGDVSVVIAVSTLHSKEAFETCEKILALIKQKVPVWKKELLSNGVEKWVDGKEIHATHDSD